MANCERDEREGIVMTRSQKLFAIIRILEDHGFTTGLLEMADDTLAAKRNESQYVVFEIQKKKDDVYAMLSIDVSVCNVGLEKMLVLSTDVMCAAQAIVELEELGLFRKDPGDGEGIVETKILYNRPMQ